MFVLCVCLCVFVCSNLILHSLSIFTLSILLASSFTNSRKRKDTLSVKSDKSSSIPLKSDKSSISSPQADVKVDSHVTLQGLTDDKYTYLNGKLAIVTEITNDTSGVKYTVLVIDENQEYILLRRMLKLVTQSKYEEMETQAKASNASNRVSMSPVSQPANLKREEGVDEPNETFDDGFNEGM